ncbi:alpha/beta fold hydrolase [Natrialbaceae archaeon A-gly3]
MTATRRASTSSPLWTSSRAWSAGWANAGFETGTSRRRWKRRSSRPGSTPGSSARPARTSRGTNFRRKLTAYPGPTLIVNGERDKVMRLGESEHAAATQGDADVVVLEDVGHVCNLHRPEDFTMLMRRFVRNRVTF